MPLPDWLACPACRGVLTSRGDRLDCSLCHRRFDVRAGVPDLVLPEEMLAEVRAARADWDALAPRYRAVVDDAGAARFRTIDRPLLRVAVGDVLEVGCGDGRLLAMLPRARVGLVAGVDLSPEMARRARERGHMAVAAIAERLPISDAAFDTVLSGYYALRFTDLDRSLAELSRVLRPGGRFGFTLLGRHALEMASRLGALRLLADPGERSGAWRLLRGAKPVVRAGVNVPSLAWLVERLSRHGLVLRVLLGTPYLPLIGRRLLDATGGHLPYWRGRAAPWFGFDLIALGVKRRRSPGTS